MRTRDLTEEMVLKVVDEFWAEAVARKAAGILYFPRESVIVRIQNEYEAPFKVVLGRLTRMCTGPDALLEYGGSINNPWRRCR